MGAITKVAKTATGVFAASLAKESYQAAKQIEEPVSRMAVTAAGSVSAAIAFHCLKSDVEEVADIIRNKKQICTGKAEIRSCLVSAEYLL